MRILPVSLTTVLVELADLDEALALLASLQAAPAPGMLDLVPAARTLMIRFQPDVITPAALAADLNRRDLTARVTRSDTLVEIPVEYNGEDLDEVARLTGLSRQEVVRRHTESEFTVAFCGFAPGFGYLSGGDPALQTPRRQSPRTRIPAGSVALAGAFSGVYPQASPGGWQIIGATPVPMWDLARDPPALLQPGGRVRFFDLARRPLPPVVLESRTAPTRAPAAGATRLEVLAAPIPALFQDLGRFGQTGQGVSASGALDQAALKAANRLVGNPPGVACLEIAGGGFSFVCAGRVVSAVTGAPAPISIQDSVGRQLAAQPWRPLALDPGDIVTFGEPQSGQRSYLSLRGGFAVEPVLGGAATDTLANIGPAPVVAGSALFAAPVAPGLASVSPAGEPPCALPAPGDTVTLDIVMGPRTDWFTPEAVTLLSAQPWRVTPQSSRVGVRLAGDTALTRRDNIELPSEGTAAGAIQVPHSGQPVLFLADHPLTGGYPVIAALAEYHLDLAGQIPVGAWVRFRPITSFFESAARPSDQSHNPMKAPS